MTKHTIHPFDLRVYMTLQNKARDAEGIATEDAFSQTAFADMTDRENPNFRDSWCRHQPAGQLPQ